MKARLDHWKSKISSLPEENSDLSYSRVFTKEEYDKLSIGLIPLAMEDKWFCYLEGSTFFMHRSWSGHCIYEIELEKSEEGHRVVSAKVNRNSEQYKADDDGYDSELIDFLISNLLLGENKPFPKPAKAKEAAHGVLQHNISGTGYKEKEYTKTSWWKFWK